MTKPYTAEQYDDLCTSDLTWRIREISDLKKAAADADSLLQRVLLRSLVTICYAHWEGHVRFSAVKFLEHVSMRRFRYDQLSEQFYVSYFAQRLRVLGGSGSSIKQRCEVVREILSSQDRQYSKPYVALVETRSNLSSDVVADICLICGVCSRAFTSESSFIDKILLDRRNAVAHGEDAFLDATDMDDITQKTTELMRVFGSQLSNAALLETYKRA